MHVLLKAEYLLVLILIAGYVGINFSADLPRFLVGENLLLAALYSAILLLIYRGSDWGQPLLLLVSAFNAGRVSRSIISPQGEIQELAKEHIPLLTLILLVSIISLYLTVNRGAGKA